MKIKDYIAPLLKWWWLVALSTAIALGTSYYFTRPLPHVYMAKTTLIVGRAITEPNPTGNELILSRQLAEQYAGISQRDRVRDATMTALGLEALPDYTTYVLPNSPFIEISVTDVSARRAQAVANELANQLIRQSPTNTQQQDQERQDFINQNLDYLQEQIGTTKAEIDQKQEDLAALSSAVQIADTQADIEALQTKLSLLQTNYTTLLANTEQGALNTLTVIETADLPTSPVGPNKRLIVLMATAAGIILSIGAAYLIEFLDRTLKTSEDIQRVLSLPVLGYVPQMRKSANHTSFVADNPRSPTAEAFRSLRTNLEFIGVDDPLRTILITSIDMGDGKTTIATNLALSIAQSEKKVVLVDCDLRRPNVHASIGMSNQPGLTDLFRERLNVFDTIRTWKDKRVVVVTAGGIPPNPTELLASKKMSQTLTTLKEMVDIVVIDGPPLRVTDALILASKVDGVLLVIRPGQTRDDVAKSIMEQVQRAGARIVGVALNRVPLQEAYAYGGYQYYAYSVNGENPEGGAARKPRPNFPWSRFLKIPAEDKSAATAPGAARLDRPSEAEK